MSNLILSLIIGALSALLLVVTEPKKENRTNTGIKSFVIVFIVAFVAITYLSGDKVLGGAGVHDIEIGEPNF